MVEKVVLGTAQFGLDYGINNASGKPSVSNVFEILDYARTHGVNELDTAYAYGSAHSVLREYIKLHPSSFSIATKYSTKSNQTFIDSVDTCMKELQVEVLKCFYFHSFEDYLSLSNRNSIIKIKESGKVSKIGVSIYLEDELENVIKDELIDVIQLPFNIFDMNTRKVKLMEFAKECGKEIYVRSVFLQGLFFKKPETFPAKLMPLSKSVAELQNISMDCGVSINSLCLNSILRMHQIDRIIIGVDNLEQIKRTISELNDSIDQTILSRINGINIENSSLLNPKNWN